MISHDVKTHLLMLPWNCQPSAGSPSREGFYHMEAMICVMSNEMWVRSDGGVLECPQMGRFRHAHMPGVLKPCPTVHAVGGRQQQWPPEALAVLQFIRTWMD